MSKNKAWASTHLAKDLLLLAADAAVLAGVEPLFAHLIGPVVGGSDAALAGTQLALSAWVQSRVRGVVLRAAHRTVRVTRVALLAHANRVCAQFTCFLREESFFK